MTKKQTIKQYEVYWVDLNPTKGSEISKIRPCVVVSPDEMNRHLLTVVIVPVTSAVKNYVSRVPLSSQKLSKSSVAIDQIRTISKERIKSKIDVLKEKDIVEIKRVIKEMFVE